MKTNRRRMCRKGMLVGAALCLGAAALPDAGWTAADGAKKADTRAKPQPTNFRMPKFTPPKRGAPVGRIAGGARGRADGLPTLVALVPDHVALTAVGSPTMYWYTSEVPRWPVELTVAEPRAETPLLVRSLPAPPSAGIQRVSLRDMGGQLEPDRDYHWYVALVRDAESRSRDLLAYGGVRRETPSPELSAALETASPGEVPAMYAAAGYWYEALDAAQRLAESQTDRPGAPAARDSLLEQVGLEWLTTRPEGE